MDIELNSHRYIKYLHWPARR